MKRNVLIILLVALIILALVGTVVALKVLSAPVDTSNEEPGKAGSTEQADEGLKFGYTAVEVNGKVVALTSAGVTLRDADSDNEKVVYSKQTMNVN